MAVANPDRPAVANHLLHCRQYMDNALEALGKDEPGKAGEMLWGSIAQAVQAVDAWRGAAIEDHRGLVNFVRRIGAEIDDPYFPNNFQSARSLHHNFYIPVETVAEVEALLPGSGGPSRRFWPCCLMMPAMVRRGGSPRNAARIYL